MDAVLAQHPDCRISGDPCAPVLGVCKRRSPWVEIARGRLPGDDRRPWLGLSFTDRFSGF